MTDRTNRSCPGAIALLAITGVIVAILGGCGDDDPSASSPETSTTAAGATSTTETTPTPTGEGCRGGDATHPGEDDRQAVDDVDGDGQPDEAWIYVGDEGATTVGIDTAAGGSTSRLWESASPVTRSVLVVDADQTGPVELLASDGRTVELWAFVDCNIQPVRNVDGDTYTFSLGFTDIGTGVGCVADGTARQLVGLDVVDDSDEAVAWSQTVVELDQLAARNGPRTTGDFTRPADAAAIDRLHQVTCGDRTMAADGLSGD